MLDDARARCVCDPGYQHRENACVRASVDASTDVPGSSCEGVNCSGHGRCVAAGGGAATCACDPGYAPSGSTLCVPDPLAGWCELDAQCDDQDPCTADSCLANQCRHATAADQTPCDDHDPCTADDTCLLGVCSGEPLDADGDDQVPQECGGQDCDDTAALVHAGAIEGLVEPETCADGADNDCDGLLDAADPDCATPGNVPPSASLVACPTAVTQDEVLACTLFVDDPDGPTTSITLAGDHSCGPWLSMDGGGALAGVPADEDVGGCEIAVEVSDGLAATVARLHLEVVNLAPVLHIEDAGEVLQAQLTEIRGPADVEASEEGHGVYRLEPSLVTGQRCADVAAELSISGYSGAVQFRSTSDFLGACGVGVVFDDENGLSSSLASATFYVTVVPDPALGPPTELRTCVELQSMRDSLRGRYALAQDIDCGASATWNGGAGFEPVGSPADPFVGVLDGRGHVVRGLFIARGDADDVGLFGALGAGAEVVHVVLEDVDVSGNNNTGALVGGCTGGLLADVQVRRGSVMGNDSVGGAVGLARGNTALLNDVAVRDLTVQGHFGVGGVAGYSDAEVRRAQSSACSITASDKCAGGITGLSATILESVSTSAVRATGSYAGGIACAVNNGVIRDCYNSGEVSAGNSAGGLVGSMGALAFYSAALETSYSRGRISAGQNAGGLIGWQWSGRSERCFWDVEASGREFSAGDSMEQGRSTAQMTRAATYEGWDFSTVWRIDEGVDYPHLRWEP